jgi:hypothetical protein
VKKRKIVWIVILIAAMVSSLFGYRSWARRAKTTRILVQRDETDLMTLRVSSGEANYDPYFNRVNFTRTIDLPSTKLLRARTTP